MLKVTMKNQGASMEADLSQEKIVDGDIKIEKIFFMQSSPLALLYFSDKGNPVKDAARFDMQKVMLIDAAPISIVEGTPLADEIHRLSIKINNAWHAAVTNTPVAQPEVEFVQPDGSPFTNFGKPQP
ncbi:MAG: hypothetical protein HYS17_06480 [Micavibrio aeruginosavorus]|uniref:Uncharacterized protein n=1 Tax=Micavibrio aeruginosavorus TaxID=349221 RepID=A0A7T5R0D4_9BACT|nr:MAG: hypothetical protein HYS17_06480 [Micavibrio aeruginosavorus]